MLTHPTADRLRALAPRDGRRLPRATAGPGDRCAMLRRAARACSSTPSILARENRKLARRLKEAKLRIAQACLEDLDYAPRRELDRALIRQLATGRWIAEHHNVLITGATGVGKTYLACALGQQACRQGYRTLYRRLPRLFQELALARADGSYATLLARLARVDVPDPRRLGPRHPDRGPAPGPARGHGRPRRRAARRSSPANCRARTGTPILGDPTIADAVLDRLVHNAYTIALKGPSRRKPEDTNEGLTPRQTPASLRSDHDALEWAITMSGTGDHDGLE